MVNAVNLTDGIDGLNSSVTFFAAIFFMVISSFQAYFGLGIASAALAGGCMGFLLWNFNPAKGLYGDTGSLFLGGMVCALAFGLDMPVLLIPIGVVYLMEMFSVMLQVIYFKLTHGKRLFKMSPIHHHFERCAAGAKSKSAWSSALSRCSAARPPLRWFISGNLWAARRKGGRIHGTKKNASRAIRTKPARNPRAGTGGAARQGPGERKRLQNGMKAVRKKFHIFSVRSGLDMPFLFLVLILVVIGLVMLFSASYPFAYYYYGDSYFFIRSQVMWAIIGVVIMFAVSYFDYHHLHKFAIPVLILSFVLLVVVPHDAGL